MMIKNMHLLMLCGRQNESISVFVGVLNQRSPQLCRLLSGFAGTTLCCHVLQN